MSVSIAAEKSSRNTAIDAAKGIGILLVVFAHIYYGAASLTYIYSFHMPLFFIFSGMLFRREKYRSFGQFLSHRFRTLICPYFFFYLVSFVIIKLLMNFASNGLSAVLSKETLWSLAQMFLAWGPSGSPNNPLWFVSCLLCMEVLYFFISKTKPWKCAVICLLLTVIGWFLKSDFFPAGRFNFLWNFDISLFAIGFYALGNLLANKTLSLQQVFSKKKLLSMAAAILCAALLYPIAMYNGKISIGGGLYQNGFLLYIAGALGTLAVLFAATVISNCRFLQYLGKNTFAIMGTHYVIRNLFNGICAFTGLGAYDRQNLLQSIVAFVAVLALSIGSAAIYNQIKKLSAKKQAQPSLH